MLIKRGIPVTTIDHDPAQIQLLREEQVQQRRESPPGRQERALKPRRDLLEDAPQAPRQAALEFQTPSLPRP